MCYNLFNTMKNIITFENENISGQFSLCENKIYVKLKENAMGYNMYEGHYTKEHIETSMKFDTKAIYDIMYNCLSKTNEELYRYEMDLKNDVVKMKFIVYLSEIANFFFDISVDKKINSDENNTFIEFVSDMKNELDILKKSNDKLIKICNEHKETLLSQKEFIDDILCHGYFNFEIKPSSPEAHVQRVLYSFNDKYVTCITRNVNIYNFSLLYAFISLDTLTLTNDVQCTCNCLDEMLCKNAHNKSMNKIKFIRNTKKTMFNLEKFPNLVVIEIENSPNLTTLELISTLKTKKHKIQNIKIINCTKIDIVELQSYCSLINVVVSSV
jgi:hypothetical protein